ncbi:MAG: hypothetical protein Q9222_000941 [Ikaeria aurantiellina]
MPPKFKIGFIAPRVDAAGVTLGPAPFPPPTVAVPFVDADPADPVPSSRVKHMAIMQYLRPRTDIRAAEIHGEIQGGGGAGADGGDG